MPIEIVPNRIELSDFSGGFAPDPEEAGLPLNQLPNTLNVIPDMGAPGAVELRPGFARLTAGRIDTLEGSHFCKHVNFYEVIDSGVRKRYLILIMSSGVDASADNIQLWAYDIVNNSVARIDTPSRSWTSANFEHFYTVIEGTYYGGTKDEEIYSWHPTNGWDADPTAPSVNTWVNTTGESVDTSDEFGRNYAFKKNQKVLYSGKWYSTARGIRYKTWEADEQYRRGERVSYKVDHGVQVYWRSFECIDSHLSTSGTGAATGIPGEASGYSTYWKQIKLQNIKDGDGDLTADWFYNPIPTQTAIGTYHGNRLFIRQQDSDNWSRLQYSAPAKPERDKLIADLTWSPTDWAPRDDLDGDGGGWLDVPFSGKGEQIRALVSYGNYLLICGRWQTYVLAGVNEQSWTLRKLGDWGAQTQGAVTEHDGLVYMLTTTGNIAVTDGTSMKLLDENNKIFEYLKEKMGDVRSTSEASYNWFPTMKSYKQFLWISLPDIGVTEDHVTLVYHPPTQSFWKTDLAILDSTVAELDGTQGFFFSTPITEDSTQTPCVFRLSDVPGSVAYDDDDWEALADTTSTLDIGWGIRTAWFQFGTSHNDRRLRRVWALVRGEAADTVQVDVKKNFESADITTATRTLVGSDQAEFVEGKVGQTGTPLYAVALEISGIADAATSLMGVGIDTEPIRTRFKRG
jgi:hypothetical protein